MINNPKINNKNIILIYYGNFIIHFKNKIISNCYFLDKYDKIYFIIYNVLNYIMKWFLFYHSQ